MYTHHERPIGQNEIQRLRKEVRKMERARKYSPKGFFGCLAGTLPICLLVILVKPHDPINRWGALVLFGIFAVMIAVIQVSIYREFTKKIREIERTIQEGSVSEHRIVTERYLEIEDDEGEVPEVYLFDVGPQGVVVLSEEEVANKKFPCSDFTLLYILDGKGQVQNVHLRTAGKPLEPFDVLLRSDVPEIPEFDRATLLPRPFEGLREELLQI